MSATGATSPSMLNTPSLTISFSPLLHCSSFSANAAMSLCA